MNFENELSIAGKTFKFRLDIEPAKTKQQWFGLVRIVGVLRLTLMLITRALKQWFGLVRIVGVLALLMIAIGIWNGTSRTFHPSKIVDTANSPFHLSRPVIAMEFLQTPEQLPVILGRDLDNKINSQNRLAMRTEMWRDFLLIACYALLYIAVSFLLARRRCPWAVYLAWVAGVCGLGVAFFDVRENLAILDVLDALELNQSVNQLMINAIYAAAISKWALSFVTAALLALTFYGLDDRLTYVGYALTLTAVLGFAGLFYPPLLPWAFVPMTIGLVLLLFLALFHPRKFITEYR